MPTRSFRTRRNASSTTSSGMPRSSRGSVRGLDRDSKVSVHAAGSSSTRGGFEDIFGNIFGDRAARPRGPQKGEDVTYTVEVDLEDAIFGRTMQVDLQREASCAACGGSAATRPPASRHPLSFAPDNIR